MLLWRRDKEKVLDVWIVFGQIATVRAPGFENSGSSASNRTGMDAVRGGRGRSSLRA